MKTYTKPTCRAIVLQEETALLQGSMSIEIDDNEDVNASDKSNRRTGLWDDFAL